MKIEANQQPMSLSSSSSSSTAASSFTMLSNNKIYKLHEFPAHAANVNAARLGHKSGRVLVTGGGDKKVNLWAVGKPNCIMSLSGHSTPISCVQFSVNEEHVCAGSQAGALKIWDLESARMMRTLTGHRSSIKSVDFHPYGDFLASGSTDSGIKMWDIRRKGCIFGYKGHNSTVNSLKFSPDGQWIASGGDDHLVKLWDIRVGKVLTQFNAHTDAVTSVEFHPHEFLLASGGADRTVKFFDLETFELVCSTNYDTSSIKCIHFHPDGSCLFAASSDSLRVHGWEPPEILHSISTNWSKIQDISISQEQLVGVASQLTNVSVFVADLKCAAEKPSTESTFRPHLPSSGNIRRNFKKEPCYEFVQSLNSMVANNTEESEESEKDGDGDSQGLPSLFFDSRIGFQPQRDLARTPPLAEEEPRLDPGLPAIFAHTQPEQENVKKLARFRYVTTTNTNTPPSSSRVASQDSLTMMNSSSPSTSRVAVAYQDEPRLWTTDKNPTTTASQVVEIYNSQSSPPAEDSSGYSGQLSSLSDESSYGHTSVPSSSGRNVSKVLLGERNSPFTSNVNSNSTSEPSPVSIKVVRSTKPALETNSTPATATAITSSPSPAVTSTTPSSQLPRSQERPLAQCQVKPMLKSISTTANHNRDHEEFIPIPINKPTGLTIEDFLPSQNPSSLVHGVIGGGGENSETAILSTLLREHQSILAVLLARLRNLRIVYNIWHSKDIKTALETAVDLHDSTVVVDLLCVLVLKPSVWTLDICVIVLPAILLLLQSKYEAHMLTGCNALRLILKNFMKIIKTNIECPIQTVGVDISREERYSKSMECYQTLIEIRAFTLKRQTLQGKIGNSFRELHNLLSCLD